MASAGWGGYNWSAEQRANANVIIRTGLQMGMSWRDITIGLMTAMQESGLRNLSYGDRDSAGLFQQRPSMGWGTFQQVTNPQYAAHKFFSTLKGVKGRDKMALTAAAQAVQRSAYPDAYAKWTGAASALVSGWKGSKGGNITPTTTPVTSPMAAGPTQSMDLSSLGLDGSTGGMSAGPSASATDALGATTAGMAGAPGLEAPTAGVSQGRTAGLMGQDTASLTDLQPFANPGEYQQVTGGGAYGQKGIDNTAKGLVQYAKQFIGTPYVWGGTDLQSGVDCSGFVQAVYKHFGINLPRVSYQQANSGTRVGLKALRPGDLVAWDNSTRNNGADHIAIYAGNGFILEAPRPGIGVRYRRLGSNEGAWGVRLHRK